MAANDTPGRDAEAQLREELADPCAASGYTVSAIAFGDPVEITLAKAGTTFVVWLKPAGAEVAHYKRTERFKIGHRGDPPDRLGYTLLDAACAQIAAWERSLSDDTYRQLFRVQIEGRTPFPAGLTLEWRAVRAGLKPAARDLVHAEAVAQLLEQAGAVGLEARATEARAYVARFWQGVAEGPTTILHVARTEAAVTAVADAERAMIETSNRGRQVTPDQVRAVGEALGYPSCCIDAFLRQHQRSNAEIRFEALRRTTGPASLLLNDLQDLGALVSHMVCRYDCPPSLDYARALVHELGPAAALDLETRLGGLMVAFRHGGALRLVGAEQRSQGIHRFTAMEASGDSAAAAAWRAALHVADRIEVLGDRVRVLRAGEEIGRLDAPPDEVQVRMFV